MLCFVSEPDSFTPEAWSVPIRCSLPSARVSASWFWVLQITLPCFDVLSLLQSLKPSAPSALILPVSTSSSSPSKSGALVVNACNFPDAEQLSCQTGLPAQHSLRYWWFPLGQREERKSRPVLFGSLLGQACWLKKENKGEEIIILPPSLPVSPSMLLNSEGQNWMLAFPVHVIKCHQWKELQVRVCGCPMRPASPTIQLSVVLAHCGLFM